ncbi:MAG: hypothetical protein GY810_08115 [Aureispira sp.]|nr:hypothetical protein [Aureispira sp.]
MKNFAKTFILGLTVVTFAASCGSETTTDNNQTFTIENPDEVRAAGMKEDFMGKTVTLNQADVITISQSAADAENEDAAIALNIRNSMLAADKEAQLLEVNFSASDEPVENGMYVFAIDTENEQDLTLEMYDEEGFEMAANNTVSLTSGNNYKALNVEALESGNYIFRLKDDQGRELSKEIEVRNQQ